MKKLTAKQVAELSPEKRALYNQRLKKIKRNRRILTGVIAVIAVSAVFAILSVTVLFNVTEIKVAKAGSHYNAEQIIEASGIETGDNIVLINREKVKGRIEKKLPYVFSIEIDRSLSGTVTLTVKDGKAVKAFKAAKGYALADENGKVLEIIKALPKNSKLTVITMKKNVNAEAGEVITFTDKNEEELYNSVCAAINEAGIRDLTGIDISSPKNIYLEYQSRYRLLLGDSEQMAYKLKEAKKVIAQEDKDDPNQIGEINLSILKKVYVEPLETLETTTAAAKPEPSTTKAENDNAQAAAGEEHTQEEEAAPQEDGGEEQTADPGEDSEDNMQEDGEE